MDLRKFLRSTGKKIVDRIKAKSYVGIIHGGIPVDSTKWSGTDFLRAQEISLYVNRAIAKRADKVGEVEFVLRNKKGDVIENDPVFNLLYRPNKLFTGRQFWTLYQKYFDLLGEAYIYMLSDSELFSPKKVKELHLLIPTNVTHKYDKDGRITSFEYRNGTKTVQYKPEEILYIHNPDPSSPMRGQSLLAAGINAIQTEVQISTYHSRILKNGGKIEGVFKFKTPEITEEQIKQMKEVYKKEYGDAKNSGIPLFLGGDADYTSLGLTPEELSFLDAKRMTLEDIVVLTGVPKSILASMDGIKFDNANAARESFLGDTIRPLLITLATALDERLFPDRDVTLDFIDPTPENVDRKLKEIESGIKNYYMSPNEARALNGLDPVEGGDDILVPFNLMSLSTPKDSGGDAGGQKGGQKNADIQNKEIDHPLQDADVRRIYWNMQIKRMDSREKPFKRSINSYLNGQRDRIINKLDPKKTYRFRKKGLLDEIFHVDPEVKIGKELFIPIISDLLKKAGVDALKLTDSEQAFNVTTDMASWIDNRSEVFMQSINDTTFKELQKQFAESFAAEEGRDELIKRIEKTYGNIKLSRAATIARTEVHNATQYGTIQGYKQGGLTTKIWVAVLDSETRDSHAVADGEEVPIDTAFSNGLLFPGDPAGDPAEVINCRCVV